LPLGAEVSGPSRGTLEGILGGLGRLGRLGALGGPGMVVGLVVECWEMRRSVQEEHFAEETRSGMVGCGVGMMDGAASGPMRGR
jgi:hypothetical protein